MDPKDIRALLEKFRAGEATPEEERLLHRWLDGLAASGEDPVMGDTDKTRLHDNMWQHIAAHAPRRQRRIWPYAAMAASIIGVAALAATWFIRPEAPRNITLATKPGEVRTFTLPDQSRVTAGPNTKMICDHRQVTLLQGKAYFEVKASPEEPFTVIMEADTATVLGTAFTTELPGDGAYRRITLLSGKVKASGHGLLTPGERITYPQKQIENIQLQDALAWTQGEILLQNAPLSEVIRTLEDQYGITVSTKLNRNAGNYTLRLPAGMPLPQVLDILQKISYKPKISFTMNKTQLTIH
ncbi:FecR family protein [Chitinophaga sp.]|uniref:FecR family protein n=1 Tax=Chitinophaga sp. TaxID=1869181 RepID=UPI00261D4CBB|nr:FecR family protein [uncultured Chitinophaga sp.]